MSLEVFERVVQWAGAAALAAFLALVFLGVARALRRPRGQATGLADKTLRWPVYLLIGIPFFAVAALLWRPLPLALSPSLQVLALALGALLYFPGLGLAMWGRLVLGEMYNVSMAVGVQLHAGHRLVAGGPYAIVRHPMYAGIMVAAWGGLLLYRTWTCVFAVFVFLGLVVRARREERALAAEFGPNWDAYCRRVPGWFPRLRRH
jgi:protein-S-isoprenylcysteine O-methyltransferase Ste14